MQVCMTCCCLLFLFPPPLDSRTTSDTPSTVGKPGLVLLRLEHLLVHLSWIIGDLVQKGCRLGELVLFGP